MRIGDAKGGWALVTGASSGIGRAFCVRLAAEGLHLVLVARRQERLEALAAELAARHGTQCLVLPLDLAQPRAAEKVLQRVEAAGVRVRILINNAAFGPWGRFENTPAEEYEALVQLVAASTVSLCRNFLPHLASFPSSAVINLSSPAAIQPVCYKAVYAAAKAFVHQFSLALHGEWKDRGVMVQTLVPGPTRTELDALNGAYKCKLTEKRNPPEEVVNASLAQLSRGTPLVTTMPGLYRQRLFAGLFPIRMIIRVVEDKFRPPAPKKDGLPITASCLEVSR